MTSRLPSAWTRLAILLCAATAPCVAAPEGGGPADADWILQAVARPAPSRTGFVELRDSPMLKQPLRLEGEYRRETDGRLIRQVHAPYAETTTLAAGEAVRIGRGGPRVVQVGVEGARRMHVDVAEVHVAQRIALGAGRARRRGRGALGDVRRLGTGEQQGAHGDDRRVRAQVGSIHGPSRRGSSHFRGPDGACHNRDLARRAEMALELLRLDGRTASL